MPPNVLSAMNTHDAPAPNKPSPKAKPVAAAARAVVRALPQCDQERERDDREEGDAERREAEHGGRARRECRAAPRAALRPRSMPAPGPPRRCRDHRQRSGAGVALATAGALAATGSICSV